VDEALRQGTLKLHGWMYDIGSGAIRQLDSNQGEFRPLIAEIHPAEQAHAKKEQKIA
jgi:carbonic anhydrase